MNENHQNHMKFEVGKYYRSKDDGQWRIVAIDGPSMFPIVGIKSGQGVKAFNSNGQAWYYEGRDTESDLVAEWVDAPVVDWAAMPKWANWVFKCGSGVWVWSFLKPTLSGPCWAVESDSPSDHIPREYFPTFTGRWKDSLVERPKPNSNTPTKTT